MRGYFDYHNHTTVCHHATGTVGQYLKRAEEQGMREFGFAEHSPWMIRVDDRRVCPTNEEFAQYYQWMMEAKETFDGHGGRPKLRVGIEADWVPARLDEAQSFIANHSFDYVYGSVHHLPDPLDEFFVTVWKYRTEDLDEMYSRYFRAVGEMAASGFCDILAHLDVIRRSRRVPERGVLPFVEEILPQIVDSGVAVEINASGRDHPNGDFFPQPDVLKLLVRAGVPITFGSDGHAVDHVGRYRGDVVNYLAECGGKQFARFDQREMILTDLSEIG